VVARRIAPPPIPFRFELNPPPPNDTGFVIDPYVGTVLKYPLPPYVPPSFDETVNGPAPTVNPNPVALMVPPVWTLTVVAVRRAAAPRPEFKFG
jgi:hypothetical protein